MWFQYQLGYQSKVSANLGFGFGIGPKPKEWFWSYTKYHYRREAKSLLSQYIYCAFISSQTFTSTRFPTYTTVLAWRITDH